MNIDREVAAMQQMTVAELRRKHIEVFGEPTRSGHKTYLVKRIAWRMQANAEGGLSERAMKRAAELARDADLRMSPPRQKPIKEAEPGMAVTASVCFDHDPRIPLPGTILVRPKPYKGREIRVRVLPKGFEYDGQVYRSLSAVAKAITGRHWNGFHFFGLNKDGKR